MALQPTELRLQITALALKGRHIGSRIECKDIGDDGGGEFGPAAVVGTIQRFDGMQRHRRFHFLDIFADHRGLEDNRVTRA
jgi:hypothetical protein